MEEVLDCLSTLTEEVGKVLSEPPLVGGRAEGDLEGGKTAEEVSLGTVSEEAVSSAINWSSRSLLCSSLLISRCSLS